MGEVLDQEPAETSGLLLEQVFHRLDVVVGGALDVLDALRILLAELPDNVVQQAHGMGAECRYLADAFVSCKGLQPSHLHQHTMTDQTVLAEDRAKGFRFRTVAAVDG